MIVTDEKTIPDLSVVIPSYNHARYVPNLLKTLYEQATEFGFEVVLVDSGTDNSAALIAERFPWVRLVRSEQRLYPGQGRNKGVEIARAPVIAFTDTDCTVDPHWVDNMVAGVKSGKNVLVGPVLNGTPFSLFGTVDYLLECFDFWNARNGVKIGTVGTGNVCFRREIFETHGPLDGFVKGSDSRFFRKVLAAGETIWWLRGVKVWHHNRTQFRVVMKNQYKLGLGAAATGRTHKSRAQFMMKYPVFVPLIPVLRYIRIGWILARKAPLYFISYVLLTPLILVGLCVHATGFVKGAFGKE